MTSLQGWPHACNQCGGFGGHESGCIGHQAPPPAEALTRLVERLRHVAAYQMEKADDDRLTSLFVGGVSVATHFRVCSRESTELADALTALAEPQPPTCRECKGTGMSRLYPNEREQPCFRCRHSAWVTAQIAARLDSDGTKAACDECEDCGEMVMCSYHSLLSELDELRRSALRARPPGDAPARRSTTPE